MSVEEELLKLYFEIEQAALILEKKYNNRLLFYAEHKREIRAMLPSVQKLYRITDPIKARLGVPTTEDDVFYFRPNAKRRTITYLFGYSYHNDNGYPQAEGIVLDAELRPIINDHDVPVNLLRELEPREYPSEITKIYVMIDRATGYYKIGRSKNPKVREKTLQSEKPAIDLMRTYDGVVSDERALHLMFAEKRIRGEWFDLGGSDLIKIDNYFGEAL